VLTAGVRTRLDLAVLAGVTLATQAALSLAYTVVAAATWANLCLAHVSSPRVLANALAVCARAVIATRGATRASFL